MSKRDAKPPEPAAAWNRMRESVAADKAPEPADVPLSTAMAELRDAGLDPEAIGERGAARAKALLEQRRLAWQAEARKNLDVARAIIAAIPRAPRTSSREVLLRKLERARNDPRLGGPIVAAFRMRAPEEASVEELASLLDSVEALRRLAGLPPDDED